MYIMEKDITWANIDMHLKLFNGELKTEKYYILTRQVKEKR